MKTKNGATILVALLLLPINAAIPAEEIVNGFGQTSRWTENTANWSTGDMCSTGPGDCSGDMNNPDWPAELQTAVDRWNDSNSDFTFTLDSNSQNTDCSGGPNNVFFASDICGNAFGGSTLAVSRWTYSFTAGCCPNFRDDDWRNDVIFNLAFNWSAYDSAWQGDPADLRRVAVHELGHSLGLAHTDDSGAIMWFQAGNVTLPQADDLAGTASLYRDNQDRSLSLMTDGVRVALLRRLLNGLFEAEIRNLSNGSLVRTIGFLGAAYVPVQLIAIPDQNGNGEDELVVLGVKSSDNSMVAQIRDSLTGVRLANATFLGPFYFPVAMRYVPDADNSGKGEIALLAKSLTTQFFLVQMRDAATGALVGNLNFLGSTYTPLDLLVLDDGDNNGVPDLAVLASRPSDGRFLVQLKNASGAVNTRSNFYLGPAYRPLMIQEVPDADDNGVPEIALLAVRDSDGRFLVQRRNTSGSRDPHNVFFLTSDYSPRAFAVLADADGNNVPDYAVLARRLSTGAVNVQLRNAAGSALTRTQAFMDTTVTPTTILATGDRDSNNEPDVVVLGHRSSDGRMRAQVRNVDGTTVPQDVFFSNTN